MKALFFALISSPRICVPVRMCERLFKVGDGSLRHCVNGDWLIARPARGELRHDSAGSRDCLPRARRRVNAKTAFAMLNVPHLALLQRRL